jgi:hypothetical protein
MACVRKEGIPLSSSKLSPTAAPRDRSILRFSALSRELRDMIYSFALHDEHMLKLRRTEVVVQPRNIAAPALLVLCRQFQSEYQDVANEHSILEIFNSRGRSLSHSQTLLLPTPATHVSSLIVHVSSGGGRSGIKNMPFHLVWVNDMLSKLPQCRSLVITMGTYEANGGGSERIEEWKVGLDSWLQLPLLEQLEVYHMNTGRVFKPTARNPFIMRWTKKHGEWEDLRKTVNGAFNDDGGDSSMYDSD